MLDDPSFQIRQAISSATLAGYKAQEQVCQRQGDEAALQQGLANQQLAMVKQDLRLAGERIEDKIKQARAEWIDHIRDKADEMKSKQQQIDLKKESKWQIQRQIKQDRVTAKKDYDAELQGKQQQLDDIIQTCHGK